MKLFLGPSKLLRTEYGEMKSVRIGWAIRGSISDIELVLERCSSNWKNPSNFLQSHFKYALKLKGQHSAACIRLSGIVHIKIITVQLTKQCTHFLDRREFIYAIRWF